MTNPGKQRILSAILFADIEGYTAIMHSDERLGLKTLNQYQLCIKEEVDRHNGTIIKNYGDGSICLFTSVYESVACAKDLQTRLLKEPKVPLRIGVHVGDIVRSENDVYGNAINIASRIEAMGVAGNVLLSKSVIDKIKNQPQLPVKSLGNFNFKNIDHPIEIFALTSPGLVVPKRSQLSKGLKRRRKNITTKSKLPWVIISLLVITILSYFIKDRFLQKSPTNPIHEKIKKAKEDEKSIAVLAFRDMSPEQDQKYFSEGISEEILNLLTRIPDFKVISRTSSFTFKGKDVTSEEIGKALKVNHILDGSVRKSKNAFRISTALIDTKNGAQIWSKAYDRSMDDIFSIQDDIAAKIIQQLEVSLMDDTIKSKAVNVDAYNLFLKAKSLRDEQNFESDRLAEELIKSSIAIDSTYAPSWAMLSEIIYNGVFSYSRYSIPEGVPLAKAAAKKSIAIDPENAIGYIALTTLNRAENDFKSADENLNKALSLDPNNTDVIYESSSYALDLGQLEEAKNRLIQAVRLDPLNYLLYYTLGLHYMWLQDYDAAEEAMNKYLSKNPSSGLAHNFMSQIYIAQGRNKEAIEAIAKDNDPYWSMYRKSIVEYAIGNRKKADEYLSRFIEEYRNEGWPNIAHVFAYRKENDKAFEWLNLAIDNNDASVMEILNYPEFQPMRKDARWRKLIKRLKLPKQNGFLD